MFLSPSQALSVLLDGVELFSKDYAMRGWDFPNTLLEKSLGFVDDGFLRLNFIIDVLSEEAHLIEHNESTPCHTLFSTHTARLLCGWVEENFIPGQLLSSLGRSGH